MSGAAFDPLEWMEARQLIQAGLDEDGARHDITSALTVPEEFLAKAEVRSRKQGVVAGLSCIAMCLEALAADGIIELVERDGSEVEAGAVLATIECPLRPLLAAERTFLNLLGLLSGTATLTRKFVEAAGPTCTILDTRKTWPGARRLQKYAVRCGGGRNHRMGLSDAILLKDNHRFAGFSVEEMVLLARERHPRMLVEVEVDNLEQLEDALALNVDRILLDNFDQGKIAAALKIRRRMEKRTPYEVSGGVRLENVATLAASGIEFISVGALTHSAPSLDIGLDLIDGSVASA
jgi:nicotinate-nucleotide pyrophosphorylase (carboxylating)